MSNVDVLKGCFCLVYAHKASIASTHIFFILLILYIWICKIVSLRHQSLSMHHHQHLMPDPAGAGHSYREGILPPQGCPCPRVFLCECVHKHSHTYANLKHVPVPLRQWALNKCSFIKNNTRTDTNQIHYFPQFCNPFLFLFSSKWISIDPWTWRGLCYLIFINRWGCGRGGQHNNDSRGRQPVPGNSRTQKSQNARCSKRMVMNTSAHIFSHACHPLHIIIACTERACRKI